MSELDRQPEQLPAEESFSKWLERQAKLPPTAYNRWVGKIANILFLPTAIGLGVITGVSVWYVISNLGSQPSQLSDQAVEIPPAESQPEVGLVLTPTPEVQVSKIITLDQVLQEKPTLIADFKNSLTNLSDEQALANLRLYIDDGAAFRRKVLYVQLKGLGEGELSVLQSYLFLKNALGIETSEGGQHHQVDQYNIGDVVRVKDFQKPAGIFLRQNPTLQANPDDPVTYDGNSLMLLQGPSDLFDEVKKEAWRIWRVRKVWWCGPSLGWQGNVWGNACYGGEYQLEEGWIWESWFGGKHPLPDQ